MQWRPTIASARTHAHTQSGTSHHLHLTKLTLDF